MGMTPVGEGIGPLRRPGPAQSRLFFRVSFTIHTRHSDTDIYVDYCAQPSKSSHAMPIVFSRHVILISLIVKIYIRKQK